MVFLASVDGVTGPAAEARVSVLDTGFTFGDAVYETLRTYGGRPFLLDRHLARLRASAGRLGFTPPPDATLRAQVEGLLARADHGESWIRVVVTRGVGDGSYHFDRVQGPTLVVLLKPYEPFPDWAYRDGLPVVLAHTRRNHRDALDPAIKSCNLLNNVLAVREAQARGAYEAVLLNQEGRLAEGASSNLFVVQGGRLRTPRLEAGLLAGVTRAVVIELARAAALPLDEADLWPEDLRDADEAFLTSTLKEVCPIATVDGQPLGQGIGPVTARLLADFRAFAAREAASPR